MPRASSSETNALTIETVGGRQRLALVEPSSAREGATPTVVVLPALGIEARYYDAFARALAERGARVVLVDHPGQGESPIRPGRGRDWGYRELVHVHAAAVHEAVTRRHPTSPFVWMGHSLGGQVALMHAGARPDAVAGVALVAAGSPWFRAWPGAWSLAMLAGTQACGVVAGALSSFPGHRVGFGGHEARRLILDWSRLARTGRFRFTDLDGEDLMARWRGPTLAVPLGGDRFAPRSAMEHLLARTGAAVTWAPWDDPSGPLDHNRWPRRPEPAADRIAAWCAGLGARGSSLRDSLEL